MKLKKEDVAITINLNDRNEWDAQKQAWVNASDLMNKSLNTTYNFKYDIGTIINNKVNLIAGVSKDNINKIKAGDVVNYVAGQVGGKGGGRPDMAMAGGNQPENLDKAIVSVHAWLEEKL